MNDEEYTAWLAQVDAILEPIFGLGHSHLPDYTWLDMYTDGLTPQAAVDTFSEDMETY